MRKMHSLDGRRAEETDFGQVLLIAFAGRKTSVRDAIINFFFFFGDLIHHRLMNRGFYRRGISRVLSPRRPYIDARLMTGAHVSDKSLKSYR